MIRASRRAVRWGPPPSESPAAARSETVLRVGDQRGNQRAGRNGSLPYVLRDVPYRITWHEFPAAAPLIEASMRARSI